MARLKNFEYYDNIHELPIENYNAFKRQIITQSIESPEELIVQAMTMVNNDQKEKGIKTLQNLYNSWYLASNEELPTVKAFAALCKDNDNLSDEGLELYSQKLNKLKFKDVADIVTEVKKNFISN